MSGRNVFEQNDPTPDEEDIKAVGEGPHIMLPPLAEGHEYAITDLPSGRKAVVVVDPNEQVCTCKPYQGCSICGKYQGSALDSPESRTERHGSNTIDYGAFEQ
jgi:hypothetical protein